MAAPLGFKTFNSGDVLTAADTNGYLMQGVWTFANAAARTAAVTSPQEGNVSFLKDTNSLEIYDGASWVAYGSGDITGVTAGTGISGGGTSGTVTVTNSMATAIDAKGDLIAGTGDDTFSRLAVGTNNHVLTADSTTATGLKWAAVAASGKSFALLNGPSGTALTGSTTVTVSSLSGYDKFVILIYDASAANASAFIQLRFNSDSGANYGQTAVQLLGNSTYQVGNLTGASNVSGTEIYLGGLSGSSSSLLNGGCYIEGANTSGQYKPFNFYGVGSVASSNSQYSYIGQGVWKNTAVVSSISVISTSGNLDNGTVYVYGAA